MSTFDVRAARARGAETGLTDEEIAFYDALAENESAREVMGEPAVRVIAHELVTVIKGNVTVDWMHRDSARANIRRHVKRLLRKYGYPPDLQDAAVQNVLQQAEALSAGWAAWSGAAQKTTARARDLTRVPRFGIARWWHCQHDTSSDRKPFARMLPRVIGSSAGERGRL